MTTEDGIRVDVLVVGAGMAGLTAGSLLARAGVEVLVLERGPEVGGNAAHSMGKLWTAQDVTSFLDDNPDGDIDLWQVVCQGVPRVREWMMELGVWVSEPIPVLHGRGHQVDILSYLHRCVAVIESEGSAVARGAWADALRTDPTGRVVGATVKGSGVDSTEVSARHTLLATGGYQGDVDRVATDLGRGPEDILLRANPHSRGDGLRLGCELGALARGRATSFYGHLISWPVEDWGPHRFLDLSMKLSVRGLLLGRTGHRFVDEARADHHNAQAVALQPDGRALLVVPREAADEYGAQLDIAAQCGAHLHHGGGIEEIARVSAEWGYNGRQVATTLAKWTAPWGDYGELTAIEVCAGITFTQRGLAIDTWTRVLAANGPIPGLLAAGADVGGVYDGGYAGGLALAGGLGLRAAEYVLHGGRAGAPTRPTETIH